MDSTSEKQQKQGKWTVSEDQALRKAIDELGDKSWKLISVRVEGRTPIQCLHRWTKILRPGLIKGAWSEEEDEKLKDWVSKEGLNKWSACSKIIKGRNGKQCRERWCNHLQPNVKKGQWTIEEDTIIFNIFLTCGSKWAFISKFLPGRTENSIKNRFYSTLRRFENNVKGMNGFFLGDFSLVQMNPNQALEFVSSSSSVASINDKNLNN